MNLKLGSVIEKRYLLLCCLDRDGTALTYQAEDLQTQIHVVIKITSLRNAQDWNAIELFKREAKVLANLDHPQIPKYINYFEIDTKSDRYFCLVREFVPGLSLAELINSHYQLTEKNICAIARKVLEILQYLHELTQPIVHQDIKPANIIRTAKGSIYLINFGAANSINNHFNYSGSNFVGTLGYVPPEQFQGKVAVASDLYSLGCVVWFLLTKKSPQNFPSNELQLHLQSNAKLSRDLLNWLRKILQPRIEDRFKSAEAALKILLEVISFQNSIEPWQGILGEISAKTTENAFVSANPVVKDLNKTSIAKTKKSPLLRQVDNTLWIFCPTADYFQPQRLKIENDIFILYVGNVLFQHSIRGKKENLSVSLIKKEYGKAEKQNICCTIYDGNGFHQFGSELNYEEQSQLVQGINKFITHGSIAFK